jgi:hypothetical protein
MKHAFSLLCLATAAASVNAANIAWVTFHAAQTGGAEQVGSDATANGVLTGAAYGWTTRAPDAAYTDLLQSAGHTVFRVPTTDNLTTSSPLIAQLNAFDLVIIGRSVNSAHYATDAESAAWNSITAPMIVTGGYVLRGGDTAGNNRLGYTQGDAMPDTTTAVTLSVAQPLHPIFQGLTLQNGNELSYATAPVQTPGGIQQRGISVNDAFLIPGAVQIATTVGLAGNNDTIIAEFTAGLSMDTDGNPATPTGGRDTLGGHRLVLLTGSRENGTAPNNNTQSAGVYDLTADGAQVFLNAVTYMAVPEPATGSMLAFGAAALLLRRRKA